MRCKTIVSLVVAGAVLTPLHGVPAVAQDCDGPLTVEVSLVRSVPGRSEPPRGFAYATELSGHLTAGNIQTVAVHGRRGKCAQPGTSIRLDSRDAGTSAYVLRRTGTSDSRGMGLFDVRPPVTTSLRARVNDGPDQVTSDPLPVEVRAAVRADHVGVSECRIRSRGSTFPEKPSHPIDIQRRVVIDGRETGYVTVHTGYTDSDGRFDLVFPAHCDRRYELVATVRASARNVAGRTTFVDVDVRTSRSG